MPPRIKITKNMGEIKETVDYSEFFGSNLLGLLDSIFLFGTFFSVNNLAFIIEATFLQSDNSTVDFTAQINGTDFTYDADGQPVDGNIDNITLLYEGEQTGFITGLATDFSDFLAAGTPADAKEFTDNLLKGQKVIFKGGSGDDNTSGTTRGDKINTGAGDDTVDGRGGKDNIKGGKGDDDLRGGGGSDNISGGKGKDTISGGNGKDTISGGRGNDSLDGGKGNDDVNGGKGRDFIQGFGGDDKLVGGAGRDNIKGGKGNDELNGGKGNDVLEGGDGDDVLIGGAGADQFLFFNGLGEGQDVIADFEVGKDKINFLGNDFIRSFEDFQSNAQNLNGSVIISVDEFGAFIRVENVTVEQLSESDFVFTVSDSIL